MGAVPLILDSPSSANPTNQPIIVHVLDGLNLGGIDNLASSLIREFNRTSTIKSYLLSLASAEQAAVEGFLVDSTLPRERALVPRSTWRGLQRISRTVNAVNQHHFTAAIIYPFNASLLPVVIGLRLAGVNKLLVHLGNPVASISPARQKTQLLCFLFRALGVTFVPCSQHVNASLPKLCRRNRQTRVIPNGCDTQTIQERALAARNQAPGARKQVLMVARLDDIKDHSTLLNAFARAGKDRADWGLWLVGNGPTEPSLRQLTRELGLDPDEIFLGRRHDIAELLGQADLFAFSTTGAEGFGIALVEAMAAGLPILASDVPACREVLADGDSGQLVAAGDVEAWTRQLVTLMDDEEQRRTLAQRSSAAAAQFDLATTARQWRRLVKP